jgi:type IV secretory pathway TraG/TraD family ATPase VirD4
MNINHMAEYTTVRDIGNDTDIYSSNNLISRNKNTMINTMITTINVMKWLLRPEFENEQPLFKSRLANLWANTGKSLFWIGAAIGVGFLIAQLSS